MTTTDTKKPKTRSITFDSLRVHCAKLELTQKVELVKELKEQIKQTVATAEANAKDAASLVNGL